MLNGNQIAVIHVAKAAVAMTEEDYRALLSGFGVGSSKDLAWNDFKVVMKHFEKMGFKPRFQPRKKAAPTRSIDALKSKVEAIKKAMNLTDGYIDAIAKRMFGVDSWKWLKVDDMHKLVAAMSYYQKKRRM